MKSARSLHSQNSMTGPPSENGHAPGDLEPSPTFITVKYGENKEALFTTWVPVNTLTEWIRKKCKCNREDTLDLVDLDGHVCNLPNHLYDYAQNVIDGRKTYVLIKIEKSPDDPVKYIPLMEDLEEHHPELKGKLNNMSSATGKPTLANKRGSKWGALRGVARMTSKSNLMGKKSSKASNR